MVYFEKLVQEATLTLPKEIQKKMENVAICIAENPSEVELRKVGIRIKGSLLGLYQGFPKTVWGRDNISGRLPDKITIFQEPIARISKTEEDIKELVKIVVWHEIAHHFGFNEKQVRALESKWRKDKNK